MENNHRYICVAYRLFIEDEEDRRPVLFEEATAERPFHFITNMGVALDAFEAKVVAMSEGDEFDFTLSEDEAYGSFSQEHIVTLDKSDFCTPDGRFDKGNVYPGSVVPLVNDDGLRFQGIVMQVKEDTVVVNLNHPLAGHDLTFKGKVLISRPATDDEIQALVSLMSHEGCSCGGCHGDCGGHDEGGCRHGDCHEHCCGNHGHCH